MKKRSRSSSRSLSRDRSKSATKRHRSKSKNKKRNHRKDHKRRRSSSSSTSSSSSSLSSSSSSSRERKRKEKKRKKKKKKRKKKKEKASKKSSVTAVPDIGPVQSQGPMPGPSKEDGEQSKARSMRPMTKEEWEKSQSVIRHVYDPETGRTRLVKGDGEILEEIVSKEGQKEINKQATKGDGLYFATKMGIQDR